MKNFTISRQTKPFAHSLILIQGNTGIPVQTNWLILILVVSEITPPHPRGTSADSQPEEDTINHAEPFFFPIRTGVSLSIKNTARSQGPQEARVYKLVNTTFSLITPLANWMVTAAR